MASNQLAAYKADVYTADRELQQVCVRACARGVCWAPTCCTAPLCASPVSMLGAARASETVLGELCVTQERACVRSGGRARCETTPPRDVDVRRGGGWKGKRCAPKACPAAGAGANLALAADIVIAAQSAYFLQAFARIGLIPDAGGTYIMPRQMGIAKAMGAALFADKISSDQASEWGMIWESVEDDSFNKHWMSRATHLASGPTATYGYIKSAIRGSFENTEAEQLSIEARLQGECGKTRDFKEGITAFLYKRPPSFEGR